MKIARWAPGLVLPQITRLQAGAAVATRLFDHIGTWATVSLRVLFAALVLAMLPGKRLREVRRSDLPAIAAYVLVVSGMNLAYFSAIGRIPLAVATAIELLGPLAVALLAARGPLDVGWVLLALAGLAFHRTGRYVPDRAGLRRRLRGRHPSPAGRPDRHTGPSPSLRRQDRLITVLSARCLCGDRMARVCPGLVRGTERVGDGFDSGRDLPCSWSRRSCVRAHSKP